ncbi:periplasmic binding protein and sugar binding domain of the LacI family protein [Bifidobacterium hapali]|uniref:Periplasmic binding protein and sugar binding domain of the LacI family protein n=1 Tax=Bifidobacterium hapali TaxID=1630172 RepID=A0A261FX92_9BIFI|nr:LacI family DNA-binding transcriptional regulator [Bifidobacterium hapali]OZG63553.1 periplasmic binding protein and sugar binding domain of the LacI family protein [Bifidobacterium hapali]
MAVTMKDVARRAGVSVATVSYALRGGQYVSEEVAANIRAAVEELGYATNQSARYLRSGRTGVIAVGVHELDIPYFYSRFAQHMVDRIENAGYKALVARSGWNASSVRESLERLSDQPSDGIIVHAGGVPSSELKRLGKGRQVVLIDDFSARPGLDTIIVPGEQGIRMATEHLLDRGCRDIAMVGVPYMPKSRLGQRVSEVMRLRGYVTALERSGIEYRRDYLYDGEWNMDVGREIAHRIVADGMPYDGIVCATDSLAVGLVRGFADRGVRVPDAVRIVGFDGISLDDYVVPSITTVAVDMDDLADKAVGMLISRIEGDYDGAPRHEEGRLKLCVRESSR